MPFVVALDAAAALEVVTLLRMMFNLYTVLSLVVPPSNYVKGRPSCS